MRLDYVKVLPATRDALISVETVVASSSLEPRLLELVKVRASQINGCASCLDMHTKDARALGEDEQRLHLVAAWREASVFSEAEIVALTLAIGLINVWNRLNVGFRRPAGNYVSRRHPE